MCQPVRYRVHILKVARLIYPLHTHQLSKQIHDSISQSEIVLLLSFASHILREPGTVGWLSYDVITIVIVPVTECVCSCFDRSVRSVILYNTFGVSFYCPMTPH